MTPAKPHAYQSAVDFRKALEDRLKERARKEGLDLQRLRKQVAFDRFLARLFQDNSSRWVLKGGYAMELRIDNARATRDIDLTEPSSAGGFDAGRTLEKLQSKAGTDLNDFFTFTVSPPRQSLTAAVEGGARFSVEAILDSRTFAQFHLDIGAGDTVVEPVENLTGKDWLAFAGISDPVFQAISKEQQFAEKLHAYTLPRQKRENSRSRDLVDMVLLIQRLGLNKEKARESLHRTFEKRKTHKIPAILLKPPMNWNGPFQEMADECGLSINMDEAYKILREYFSRLIAK
jgi:predicted nucleotidyltransferase component of viral defense system